MDHVIQGKQMTHFRYPPLPLPDTEGFEDSLKVTIPVKLNQLLTRLDELREERTDKLEYVRQKTKRGSDEEYFLTLLAESRFSETYYIQKLLKYWLTLWQRVTNKLLPSRLQNSLNKVGDFEIEKAKQHPLEDLYEGRLRQSGSRLTGLCPFHEEETPSFFIFPDNHYHCYGCGVHGDPVTFVMKIKGFAFPEAVRYLL